jgi:hypothetical protein
VRKKLLMITLLASLSSLSGCVRTVASQYQAQEAPLSKPLKVPGPDPTLFPKCKAELLAQTSGPGLPSSCSALRAWRCSTMTCSKDEMAVAKEAAAAGNTTVPARD